MWLLWQKRSKGDAFSNTNEQFVRPLCASLYFLISQTQRPIVGKLHCVVKCFFFFLFNFFSRLLLMFSGLFFPCVQLFRRAHKDTHRCLCRVCFGLLSMYKPGSSLVPLMGERRSVTKDSKQQRCFTICEPNWPCLQLVLTGPAGEEQVLLETWKEKQNVSW